MGRAKVIPGPAKLLPFQAKWVKDTSRLKIAEKSRQIGWTWATAYGLVARKALMSAALDSWISSRDDIQARLFLEDCKGFAKVIDLGAKDLGEKVIDDTGHTAFVLAMANGLRLHSMSSNPDAQAGKRGDRVLDEFALHPDPRKLYAIAYPGITWGGQLEIFSTHRGSGNYFNKLLREIREKGNPKGWSHHKVTLQDALDQGFLYKLQSKLPGDDERQEMDEAQYFDFIKAGAPDDEAFLQEYMCVPADDASAFIPWELLDGCTFRADEEWELSIEQAHANSNGIYGGVDVGRDHDLTSFTAVEKLPGLRPVRKRIDLKGIPFSEQEGILYPWFAACRRVNIDKNGIGRQFAERAAQRFGKHKIVEFAFTGPKIGRSARPLEKEDIDLVDGNTHSPILPLARW